MLNPRVARVLGWVDLRRLPHAVPQHAASPAAVAFEGVDVASRGHRVEVIAVGNVVIVSMGEPRFDPAYAEDYSLSSTATAWGSLYARYGPSCLQRVKGSFALILIDLKASRVIAATDRFAVYPLCYS